MAVEIVQKGNRKVQYLIAYAVALATVATGCFSSWPAPVMPKFRNNETDVEISDNELAWMVSMTSPGFVIGSLACRFIADRFGRKSTILLAVVPSLAGSIIVAFAVKAWLLYIARLLWGSGTGMISTVAGLYLAEIADKEIRGSVTLVTRFMFNFGNLLLMCIGPFVSYKVLNYMILALPVIYFISCWFIPESPYYWLKEGKPNSAKKVLMQIRKYKDSKMLEDDLLQMQADVRNEMRSDSSLKELFTSKKYRKAIIISAGLKLAQLWTGQLVLQQYLGLIMMEGGVQINLPVIFIIFGTVRFVTSVMSSMLADRLGRRPLLIYSFIGTGVSLAVIGIYFFFQEVLQYDRETLRPYNFIPFAGMIACNIISTLGYYSVIVVIPAEIFPLNVKAIAMTCFSIYGGLIHFGEARGYQVLKDAAGLCGVFLFLSTGAFFGGLFSTLYVPETKGKSLKDIQIQLQGKMYEADDVFTKLNGNKCELDMNGLSEGKELLEFNKNRHS